MDNATTTGIRLRCPECDRGLAPAPLLRYAEHAIDRRCPRCGAHWRVILRPLAAGSWGVATQAEWVPIRESE